MRFGLFGGPVVLSGGPPAQDAYVQYIDYVVEAESLGFESVFLTEHHFSGVGQASAPMMLLANLAARTTTMRLGTGVTVLPWYNAIMVAEQAATLDVLSGGRLDFGVGRGFRAAEFNGFGISMDEAQERYDEALEVLRKAWRSDGRWSHHGTYWHYEDVLTEPAPAQTPHPPLWMGAGSPPGLRHAAEAGFNLLLDQFGSFEKTGERVAVYRERLAELGIDQSDYDVGVTRSLHIVDSAEERERAIEFRTNAMKQISSLANAGGNPTNRMAEAFGSEMRTSTEEGAIIGDANECIERLERLAAEGVDYVLMVDIHDAAGAAGRLRKFALEVMPALRAKAAVRTS